MDGNGPKMIDFSGSELEGRKGGRKLGKVFDKRGNGEKV